MKLGMLSIPIERFAANLAFIDPRAHLCLSHGFKHGRRQDRQCRTQAVVPEGLAKNCIEQLSAQNLESVEQHPRPFHRQAGVQEPRSVEFSSTNQE